ncbi:MAG: hypothetical protein NT154_29885, partial [Verrucomicrobia bacterium]|nr:hypothetical protein [Verrucomicrobiota bacterium]
MNEHHVHREFIKKALLMSAVVALSVAGRGHAAEQTLTTSEPTLWESGTGDGFRPEVHTLTLEAGANYGLECFGSRQSH